MAEPVSFEVRLANGELEPAESLWAARHVLARRVAFAADPAYPRDVLPAKIWKKDRSMFGGRVFVEEIRHVAELSVTD